MGFASLAVSTIMGTVYFIKIFRFPTQISILVSRTCLFLSKLNSRIFPCCRLFGKSAEKVKNDVNKMNRFSYPFMTVSAAETLNS